MFNITTTDPLILTLLGTGFTWGVTALGAAMVFFFKTIKQSILNVMLGFASGVMVAASFWSLLAPAIELASQGDHLLPPWLIAAIGFLGGAIFLWLADHLLPHMHFYAKDGEEEGIHTNWRRSILLVLSITLHNIPEGMAVGVAFGAINQANPESGLLAAIAVALGIGLQNFPEGAAVSIPLRREGLSRTKSFMYGQASGLVEPIAGVIGCLLVESMKSILPYALAFAAGAMLYVVVEELIPEAQTGNDHDSTHRATFGFMIGFAIMMVLDVALG